jgi:hypothetical protein
MQPKYPVNKPLRLSLIGLLILFLLYTVTQILPFFVELLNTNSLYNAIGALGLGICLFTYSITNTYYAWKLDKVSFLEWDSAQQLISNGKAVNPDAFDVRWPTRLITMFLALLSLVVIAAAIYWIFKMIVTH